MTILEKTIDDPKDAFNFLEDLAYTNNKEFNKEFIFRGQGNSEHRLKTSYQRFSNISHELRMPIDDLLTKFRVGLIKMGINPFESDNRQDWLEFSRHHGLPTPCLDFTYSPYVALFFAFNGIRNGNNKDEEYVVLYALDINQLSSRWASWKHDIQKEKDQYNQACNEFRLPKMPLFKEEFPVMRLQFIPFPSKFNLRMQRQIGALLYDTLDYKTIGYKGLEDFIDKYEEPDIVCFDGENKKGDPTLFKVFINKKCIRNVMERLELMGINGGTLFMNADGVAMDVINANAYNMKTGYLRNVNFWKETKILG